MLTARDIMTPSPLFVTVGTKVTEAARIMLEHHFNGLPVVEQDGTLRGVICQSDLVAQHKHLHMPSYFVILDAIISLLAQEIRGRSEPHDRHHRGTGHEFRCPHGFPRRHH